MGLNSIIKGTVFKSTSQKSADAVEQISKEFPVGEITEEDCSECNHKCYPKSLKVDAAPLFDSAPKTYAQILVATGQQNWVHDITEQPEIWGQICKVLSEASDELAAIAGGKVRVNGTDMDFDEGDKTVVVTVLPQFVKIRTTPQTCLADVKTILKLKPRDKLPGRMIPSKDMGYVLLCSHRARDKRCGVTAPLMRDALNMELREAGLYRDYDDDDEGGGVKVVLCNHVGGHKFAANALIYKSNGASLMFARMRPEHARAIVQKTLINDIIFPDHIRSFNRLDAYSW